MFYGFFYFACLPTIIALEEIPKVKYIPPAYLEKVDVIAYERHSKLVYKVQLPEFHTLLPKEETCPNLKGYENECVAEAAVRELFVDYYSDLMTFNESVEPEQKRPKRQVGVAALGIGGLYVLHSAINKFSNALFGSEDQITEHINKLRNSVKYLDQKNFIMEEKIIQFAGQMKEFQKVMVDRIYANVGRSMMHVENYVSKLYHLLLLKIDHDLMMSSIDSCRRKEFPVKLVPIKTLIQSLRKLESQQLKLGNKLAIPIKSISEYFKIPIFDCFWSETMATVIVNVPLVKVNANWSVYKIMHYQFAYQGQTCTIYPQESAFLATSKNRNVLITSHMLPHCSVDEHRICLIPQFQTDSAQSLNCAAGILKNKPVRELSRVCAFRCASNMELSINQVANNRLVVTNAEEISIMCPTYNKTYKLEKLGAAEVILNCNCTTIIDKNHVIDPFYCYDIQEASESFYRTIPTLWSILDSAYGTNSHTFTDHNLTLNLNWTSSIPTLNISAKHVLIPDPFTKPHLENYILWSIVILNFFLVMVLFVLLCGMFRFLVRP